MKPLKKEDINQDVFDLYDDYAHNKIDRRKFVEKLSLYAIGGVTVSSLLSFITPNYVDNLLVKPDSTTGKLSGVIVVHENRGLNPYIEDVGRRTAIEGFISLAPDALSPLGGYPGNDDDGRELQRQRDRNEMLEDFIAAYNYLMSHEDCNGKIGVVGFCFGGWISNMMAVKIPTLKAAVPFYGGQPSTEDTLKIKAPLLLQYAGLDTRVNAGWPDYETALKENNVEYTAHFYPDVNHGFHNNTTPRYDEKAATLAWERTIAFFKEKLK